MSSASTWASRSDHGGDARSQEPRRKIRRLSGPVRHRLRNGARRHSRADRRQRRRQVDVPQVDRRPDGQQAGRNPLRGPTRSACSRPTKSSPRELRWFRRGGGCSAVSPVEENLKVGAFSGRTGRWTLDTVYALFPVLKERRQNAGDRAIGRPAADGRDRPRADVEPATFSFAMRFRSDFRQPSSRTSTPSSPRSAPKAFPSSSSSRTSTRRCEQPTTSIASCTAG